MKRRKESRAGSEMALLANALLGEVKKIREGTEDVKRKIEDLEKKSQAPSREGAFFTPPVGRLRLGRLDETPSEFLSSAVSHLTMDSPGLRPSYLVEGKIERREVIFLC